MYSTRYPPSRAVAVLAFIRGQSDEKAAQKLAFVKPEENGRLITVRFDSTGGDVLPWTFVPVQLDVKVVPGETALSFFRVINLSDHPIMAVTTYNEQPEEEKKKTRKENKIQPGSDGEPKSLVSTMRSGFVKLIYCGIIADAISFLGQVSKLDVAHEVFDDYRAMKMAISTEERERIKHSANDKGDHERKYDEKEATTYS
jgi:cytochrome c oxidase assembly protein subunit 11